MNIKLQGVSNTEIGKFDGTNIVSINDLLTLATKNNCSDLFIKVGTRPYVNRFGKIIQLNVPPTDDIDWNEWYHEYVSNEDNARYVREKTLDFALVSKTGYRYRINIGFSQGYHILTARTINMIPPKFVENGGTIEYPENAKNALKKAMSSKKGGMIIFAAPTGNGKTTTLGACINSWGNDNGCLRDTNMITLEDPIEYLYNNNNSFRIVQKELGTDFKSFSLGIKSALREHPQIICIGETRDKETIINFMECAKTGHLAISTFHTKNISSTISRLLDNFSDSLADSADLISNLSLIICQRLIPENNNYKLEVEYVALNYEFKHILIEALKNGDSLEFVVDNYIDKNKGNSDICGIC